MKTQKPTRSRIIVLTLALAGILAVPAAIMRAQSYGPVIDEPTLAQTSDGKSERMEGSWVVTVTAAVPPGVPQPPSFRAYASFARGGVLIGSDTRRAASKQHGTWTHLRGNEFAWTAFEQLFNETGEPGNTVIIRVRVAITGDNDLVGVSKWDPLESTCRHASLSIL